MHFSEWEPVYLEIIKDLGIERSSDEASARSLRMLTLNSNIISEESLASVIAEDVIIAGGNISGKDMTTLRTMLNDASDAKRTLISAGSATDVLVTNDIIPDIAVTDLDGDAGMQKKASLNGTVTLVHAHGDNTELIMKHVKDLKGPIMMTTQSSPSGILCNFGGFTDGDRAVCMARHFGAKRITLIGFDFDTPAHKPGTDAEMKKRKLGWAKKVIFGMNPPDVSITMI
ncbi:MAG: DUF115 domain-containing protein [Methanomassiliicoccaceae archaeon]|nr:DUF115 domain-containing protein [Methanomassiliicoccaceae archaeon]